MNHKVTLPQSGPPNNGQPTPEENGDLDFIPADLERSPEAGPAAGPDPFDLAALRLPQDFSASMGVKKALLSLPVRKPDKSWWIRVHPSEDYRVLAGVIDLKADRGNEIYWVLPALWPELATEATFRWKLLATAINRQGTLFLWEVNPPRPDGRADEWGRTAMDAVNLATKGWVRVVANMDAGFYDVFQAPAQLVEAEWPEQPFKELLRIAFRDRLIQTLDHSILRKLRGEV